VCVVNVEVRIKKNVPNVFADGEKMIKFPVFLNISLNKIKGAYHAKFAYHPYRRQ